MQKNTWQIENLTQKQFAELREEAKQQLAQPPEQRGERDAPPKDATIQEWNAVLVAADDG